MLNKVIMIGRLTRDVDLRVVGDGTSVANSCLACNSKHGEKEEVVFLDVTVWGKRAEAFEQYIKKGDLVYVEGRLVQNEWSDKQTGQKRTKLSLVVDEWQFPSTVIGRSLDK